MNPLDLKGPPFLLFYLVTSAGLLWLARATRLGGRAVSEPLEAALARLYVDAAFRARLLAAPEATARAAGLDKATTAVLLGIDRVGLELAARSFERKRAAQSHASASTGPRWLGGWRQLRLRLGRRLP